VARILGKTKLEKGLKSFFSVAVKVGLWILLIIIVANALGINTTSLVAVVSIAGLALSLALQDILANLFNGMTVLATKPFVSGDYISVGGDEGTVQAVGLFYTTVLTVDNKCVHVPNKDIASGRIQNFSSEPLRRVDLAIGASYDCAIEDVRAALLKAAGKPETALSDPAPFAAVVSYGDSCINYTLRVWTRSENYWDTYFALNHAVSEAFAESGVKMSYNHINVHMVQ